MRIWQKTLLNSPVSFYGIEIPFRHAEKPTGFLQPVLLLYWRTNKTNQKFPQTDAGTSRQVCRLIRRANPAV